MIGNDIVDLASAQKESNWERKGFLDKIFMQNEQTLILKAENPTLMVWNLWSRKEAAYKIYHRQTGIRGYIPLQFECFYESENTGTISIHGNLYYTQTQIHPDYIYTEAVAEWSYFQALKTINPKVCILKTNGIPYLIDVESQTIQAVSITHHGRFWKGISIDKSVTLQNIPSHKHCFITQ